MKINFVVHLLLLTSSYAYSTFDSDSNVYIQFIPEYNSQGLSQINSKTTATLMATLDFKLDQLKHKKTESEELKIAIRDAESQFTSIAQRALVQLQQKKQNICKDEKNLSQACSQNIPDLESKMKNLGSKIPAVQNLRHKVDLMNELNPELKSLIREIDDITDMSDMKVAKKAGKIIKQALDRKTQAIQNKFNREFKAFKSSPNYVKSTKKWSTRKTQKQAIREQKRQIKQAKRQAKIAVRKAEKRANKVARKLAKQARKEAISKQKPAFKRASIPLKTKGVKKILRTNSASFKSKKQLKKQRKAARRAARAAKKAEKRRQKQLKLKNKRAQMEQQIDSAPQQNAQQQPSFEAANFEQQPYQNIEAKNVYQNLVRQQSQEEQYEQSQADNEIDF